MSKGRRLPLRDSPQAQAAKGTEDSLDGEVSKLPSSNLRM